MPITLDIHTTKKITLEDYLACLKHRGVNWEDKASIIETAPDLKALSNNKKLIAYHVNNELKATVQKNAFQSSNVYSASIFFLHQQPEFSIRFVVWPSKDTNLMDPVAYYYQLPHAHGFDFMTCGHIGPGYQSQYFAYDHTETAGYVGEQVPSLHPTEHITLTPGKVMYIEAFKDVHDQSPPASLSVSLNLIINANYTHKLQYDFNIQKKCIALSQSAHFSSHICLLKMARLLGNENTYDILTHLARQYPCPKSRSQCYRSLMALSSTEQQREEILNKAAADKNPLVRRSCLELGET